MKKMNIKQALKQKSRLLGRLNRVTEQIPRYNLHEVDHTPAYDIRKLLKRQEEMLNEYIELKTKIHLASGPVREKIFLLSELKSQAFQLSRLKCDGVREGYSGKYLIPVISAPERDKMVAELESRIEDIQDELDHFNFKTLI